MKPNSNRRHQEQPIYRRLIHRYHSLMSLPKKPAEPMLVNLVKGLTGAYFQDAELPSPEKLFEICKTAGLEQFIDDSEEGYGIHLVRTPTEFRVHWSERGQHEVKKYKSLEEAVRAKIACIYKSLGK